LTVGATASPTLEALVRELRAAGALLVGEAVGTLAYLAHDVQHFEESGWSRNTLRCRSDNRGKLS